MALQNWQTDVCREYARTSTKSCVMAYNKAMSDEADRADIYIEQEILAAISRINTSMSMAMGECDMCGEEGRLIDGICVPCTKLHEERQRRWRQG